MEYKDFGFKIKTVDEAGGKFTGLASTYGEPPDLMGDVIEPGAFTQAIKQQGPGYPLLFTHKQDRVLGLARLEDSSAGLLAHGELDMADPQVQAVFNKIRMKALRGLSIGWLPAPGKVSYTDTGRHLKEVKIFEISLTPVPGNPGAQILSVKSLSEARLLFQHLNPADIPLEMLEELKRIDLEVKRVLAAIDPERQAAVIQKRQEAELLRELQDLARDIAPGHVM